MSLIAGLRERRERAVELQGSRSRVQVLEETALVMLDCVQALVLDLEEIGAPELRETLTTLRGRVGTVTLFSLFAVQALEITTANGDGYSESDLAPRCAERVAASEQTNAVRVTVPRRAHDLAVLHGEK